MSETSPSDEPEIGAMEEKRQALTWDGDDGRVLEAAKAVMAADPKRGVFLSGTYGSGKTTAVRELSRGAWFFDCNDCTNGSGAMGLITGDERYTFLWWRDAIVDDLGAEEPFFEYGVKREVMRDWLTRLYAMWKGGNWNHRLFVTTNLDGKEFIARYTKGVLDRILEMCFVGKFTGKSKRPRANDLLKGGFV